MALRGPIILGACRKVTIPSGWTTAPNWLSEKSSYRQVKCKKLAHLVTLKDGRYLLTVPGTGEDQLNIRIYGKMVRRYIQQ